MKTDVLIQTLAKDASPVKPLDDAKLRLFRWSLFAGFCIAVGIFAWGLTIDLFLKKSRDIFFLIENASLLFFFGLSAFSAISLSVPGLERPPYTRLLPPVAFFLWLILIGFHYFDLFIAMGHPALIKPGLRCVLRILSLGIPPAFVLFYMVRKAAPLKTAWAGLFISAAAFSLATFANQFICANEPAHVFIWHFLPVLLLSCVGALIGNAIYSRNRRTTI